MIRVLVADDSSVVAEIFRTILERDPEVQVVGFAKNGEDAVELTRRLKPDVVLMDVRMPVMDGIEATTAIMAETPVPILVVSGSVMEDTQVAFRAIQAGAIDVVEKPAGTLTADYSALDLVRRVKLVSRIPPVGRGRPRQRPQTGPAAAAAPLHVAPSPTRVRVLAIAASTGGPPALEAVLGGLPADLGCPVLAVQHIAHGFLEGFVQWLGSVVRLSVRIARPGEIAQPGCVYFPPEGFHVGFSADGRVRLSDEAPLDGHRPSATWMFRSVAESCGARSVGVLLTGMGRDGADGLAALRSAGGRTICQDESTCVVYGMPRAAVELGAAEHVLPLDRIAGAVLASVGSP